MNMVKMACFLSRGLIGHFSFFFNIEKLLIVLLSYVNVLKKTKKNTCWRICAPRNVQNYGMLGAEVISFSIRAMIWNLAHL